MLDKVAGTGRSRRRNDPSTRGTRSLYHDTAMDRISSELRSSKYYITAAMKISLRDPLDTALVHSNRLIAHTAKFYK